MDDVRYLTDGDLTYIEFDTIACRTTSQKSWPLLEQLNQPGGGREAGGSGGGPPAPAPTRLAAPQLSLGHYAASSPPAGRDLPLREVFVRLAQTV